MAAKDLYEKDYYQILGVTKGADSAAIKKQYRKLARELHPDKTKGDADIHHILYIFVTHIFFYKK